MSTFLQLCQSLRTECGVSGTDSTVTNASGEWGRLVGWIRQAWVEIQEAQSDWEWMRKTVTFNTVASQGEYTPAQAGVTDLGEWKANSFRAYLASAGVGTEQLLGYKGYNTFRDYYLLSTRKLVSARPTEITISPSKSLILGLIPNDIYTVSGEYYKAPIQLSIDGDTPDMPAMFHMAIVYRAMMHYGSFEAAPEVHERGQSEYKRMMASLRRQQLPKITRGGSMI